MMSSARFKTAQFWSVLIRGEWVCSVCSYQRRWCGVPARRTGTAERVWNGNLAASMESPWRAQFGYWTGGRHDSWQRMQRYAPSLSVSTAGNGCGGMQRLTVSRQLVTDAVVCSVYRCLDSW